MSHYGEYKLKIALKNPERIEQSLQEIARQREGFFYTYDEMNDEYVTHYEPMEVYRKDNLRIRRKQGADNYKIEVDLWHVEQLTSDLTDEITVAYQYASFRRALEKQRFSHRVNRQAGNEISLTARGY